MLCRVAAVCPYIIIVQVIFIFFGIIEPILVILKIKYHLSRRRGVCVVLGKGGGGGRRRVGAGHAASQTTVLHMRRLYQTESPIFMILCVLCFQRQSFFTFILHDTERKSTLVQCLPKNSFQRTSREVQFTCGVIKRVPFARTTLMT